MSLSEKYELVQFPPSHYVYLEVVGPFIETAFGAWQNVLQFAPQLAKCGDMKLGMSLYNVASQTYRAGFTYAEKPSNIPQELSYEYFEGGKYIRFELIGSYSQMPSACGRVEQIVRDNKLEVARDRWNIELYTNDPKTTPESELRTEILVPAE